MKFCIPFIDISKYILINFQTNPMFCWNFFTFVHELLDNPSYFYLGKSLTLIKNLLLSIFIKSPVHEVHVEPEGIFATSARLQVTTTMVHHAHHVKWLTFELYVYTAANS